jgi:hypothetical protein
MAGTDLSGNEVPWSAVRQDYEAGEMTVFEVVRQYRLRHLQLENYARRNKWVRPGGTELDRRVLIYKMFGLLERQMELAELAMDSSDKRETAAPGEMIKSLDKMIALEKASVPAASSEDAEEMTDIRRRLEARIHALKKGR